MPVLCRGIRQNTEMFGSRSSGEYITCMPAHAARCCSPLGNELVTESTQKLEFIAFHLDIVELLCTN